MTKIDIISGFLGAGKTTLIKKLIKEAYANEKIVLIENEFGEIGVDQTFLKEAGIEITEMNSGCICCSLVGDFETALQKVLDEYHPDRIIIEPSGVGKLSDVIQAVKNVPNEEIELNNFITVIDAKKCKIYTKNFGEFFNNQIEYASLIVLSRSQNVTDEKLNECIEILRQYNQKATIMTTPWDELDGSVIVNSLNKESMEEVLLKEVRVHHHDHDECECGHHHHNHEECECGHHHHDHEECECGHHHHDHEECECGHHHHNHEECECGHHHHDHEECECGHHHHNHEECECGHHHHDHEECECGHHHHDHEECECGHHHHDHEECGCGHHHHADEVFTSWAVETPKQFTKSELETMLNTLIQDETYGNILRAKGIVRAETWLEFDIVPGEIEIRDGHKDVTGKICVIGEHLNEEKLKELFNV